MKESKTIGDRAVPRRADADGEPGGGEPDVVIVGAGVAGLSCAAALARSGLRVTVVEARDRVGGRVLTVRPPAGPLPVELGAEFVHGTPPELLSAIREAGLTAVPALEGPWRAADDGLRPASWQEDAEDSVFGLLDADRTPDRTVDDFLADWTRRNPGGAAGAARAREYVAGFHAADPALMGERALAHEMAATEAEGGERSLRLPAGYDRVVDWLRASAGPRVAVRLQTVVTAVRWRPGASPPSRRRASCSPSPSACSALAPATAGCAPTRCRRATSGRSSGSTWATRAASSCTSTDGCGPLPACGRRG